MRINSDVIACGDSAREVHVFACLLQVYKLNQADIRKAIIYF